MHSSVISTLKAAAFLFSFLLVSSTAWADGQVTTPAKLYFPALNTVGGNPNGKVTVVEFFDYNCGYCHQIPALFSQLTQTNPNVRIVYRDYPVLGDESLYAARAALAASKQGKYIALHDALFATHDRLSDRTVGLLASAVGLDAAKFTSDLNSKAVQQQLKANGQAAAQLQLNGVPVVIVAATPTHDHGSVKSYMITAPSFNDLQDAISKVGAAGRSE